MFERAFAGIGEAGEVGRGEVTAAAAGEGEAAGGFRCGEGWCVALCGDYAVGVVGDGEDGQLLANAGRKAAHDQLPIREASAVAAEHQLDVAASGGQAAAGRRCKPAEAAVEDRAVFRC